ncbi:MAG TPA: hypothetical protein VNT03_20080, partial [Baekduia sp.]|nr:hypothetical protein [Baekduia sp.]
LPAAYRDAAAAAAAIAPRTPTWPRRIVDSLRETAVAYAGFERTLLRADRVGYADARTLLRVRRSRLRRLLQRYSPSPPMRAEQ